MSSEKPSAQESAAYEPQEIEPRIAALWEKSGAFACGREGLGDHEPYAIVLPPPNVTGVLHMGHALNATLQDILARFERMRGKDVLWQPGTDHAGIATQLVVEKQLAAEGNKGRREMGREKFLERVWQWKDESGDEITKQLKRLGVSCDWSRARFTMDEGLSEAVQVCFLKLYEEGLIYRDKRLVNWDTYFRTALSDLEVLSEEREGTLWSIRYPLADEEGAFLPVATTRPETIFADGALAVHPDNPKYQHRIGQSVLIPAVGRKIPVIADPYADPEMGTGIVKISPAHDFNDFEIGKKHDLPMISIMDEEARLIDPAPKAYQGMDRFDAREAFLKDLKQEGLLEAETPHRYAVPIGDRSRSVIEPRLTDQWYVDAKSLAAEAIRAVEDGRTEFIPSRWSKTYFEWMRNIRPWCISRQLWWGHRIPVWYGPDETPFAAKDEQEAESAAQKHYKKRVPLRQEDDVLDTWFSSALWAFSTLGWPKDTKEFERYYPTSILVTGFDIIFFWVARMMMMGLHFTKTIPFHKVYIHALVRDEKGQKMTKSRGNVVNPLGLVEKYGADALRFTLAAQAAQGRDIKLSPARVQGYRNFATKLWNAQRFCSMHDCVRDPDFDVDGALRLTQSRWLRARLDALVTATTRAIEDCRFNDAAQGLYDFVWHVFCDWHLEMAKPLLMRGIQEEQAELRNMTAHALQILLRLLHPFMPFVTEALAAQNKEDAMLLVADWPLSSPHEEDGAALQEMEWVLALISLLRSVRADLRVPPAALASAFFLEGSKENAKRVARHADVIQRLARLSSLSSLSSSGAEDTPPRDAIKIAFQDTALALDLGDAVDLAEEQKRLQKEERRAEKDLCALQDKLRNQGFLSSAPQEVIATAKTRLQDMEKTIAHLRLSLSRLKDI